MELGILISPQDAQISDMHTEIPSYAIVHLAAWKMPLLMWLNDGLSSHYTLLEGQKFDVSA